MIVFLGDIAFYTATLIFAVGIFMVHHAFHHATGKPCLLLKSGGYLVIVISLLGMLCTGYFWFKYYSQGAYSTPHQKQHSMMLNAKMKTEDMSGMQHCMREVEGKSMDPDMMMKMKSCMMKKNATSIKPKENHEDHH